MNPPDLSSLNGLRVAVTGGTSGLGLALVKALRARGAEVAFIARDAQRVAEVARQVAGSHATDRDRDGVSGRAARIVDAATGERRIGRFGWKGQHATLLSFSADAYRNEMGITNAIFPAEVAYGVTAERMRACDPIGDPEDIPDPRTRRRGIDNFTSFMRLLGPVAREGSSELTRGGEQLFAAIGCATCHRPALSTGPSSNPLFDRTPVPLFSDLLLHDVGTGDGIVQGPADADEIRTPALWGLRLRRPLLHDGSAATPEDAVRRHGGEAELARRGFVQLPDADRAALLAFLRSL